MGEQSNHPAFPCEAQPDRAGVPPEHDYIQTGIYSGKFPGITIRDYFAAMVLAAASALPMGATDFEHRAKVAYGQADAMLKERARAQAGEGASE